MLLDLIAFGVIAAATGGTGVITQPGVVSVPASQTAVVQIGKAPAGAAVGVPGTAFAWQQPLDPADRAFLAFDFTTILDGENIASLDRVTMSALGASLGVEIDPDRPIILDLDGQIVGLWFRVDPSFQTDPAFSAPAGTKVGVALLISTDATPPKQYERTAVLTVVQQ